MDSVRSACGDDAEHRHQKRAKSGPSTTEFTPSDPHLRCGQVSKGPEQAASPSRKEHRDDVRTSTATTSSLVYFLTDHPSTFLAGNGSLLYLSPNFVDRICAIIGFHPARTIRKISIVLDARAGGNPPAEIEWDRAICGNPFAVEAPRQVEMGGVGVTALAGWMPDPLASTNIRPGRDPVAAFDVHVEHRPRYPSGTM